MTPCSPQNSIAGEQTLDPRMRILTRSHNPLQTEYLTCRSAELTLPKPPGFCRTSPVSHATPKALFAGRFATSKRSADSHSLRSLTPAVTGPRLHLRRASEQAHFEDEPPAARLGPVHCVVRCRPTLSELQNRKHNLLALMADVADSPLFQLSIGV
jgi:hypothetical protein